MSSFSIWAWVQERRGGRKDGKKEGKQNGMKEKKKEKRKERRKDRLRKPYSRVQFLVTSAMPSFQDGLYRITSTSVLKLF